jgi:hypothetical protein
MSTKRTLATTGEDLGIKRGIESERVMGEAETAIKPVFLRPINRIAGKGLKWLTGEGMGDPMAEDPVVQTA